MSYRFEIAAGASKKFLVGGKYCEEDIIVTALGGSDAPDVPDAPVTPEYSEGLEYEYDSDYGGAVVMGYGTWDAWSGEDLVIPPTCVIDGVEYNVVYIEYNAMQFGGMKTVRLPETIAVLNSGNFCYSAVTHLYIPFIRTVDSWCFLNESNLQHVQFKDVEYIGDSCFHKCSGTVFDFAACTTVPTLDMEYYDSSYNFGTDPVILVPENLLEEWKQATNWTLYADYIVAEGQENAQEKTIDITENGSYEVIPDEGKLLRKVTANVAVEKRFKTYYVNIPTAVAAQFVTVVSGDPDVAAHYADDAAFVTVRKMTNNDSQGTALIAHGNHSFGGEYGAVLVYKSDGTRGAGVLDGSLTTDLSANGHAYVRCTSAGDIKVYAQRLQNNFGGADYIITFSW